MMSSGVVPRHGLTVPSASRAAAALPAAPPGSVSLGLVMRRPPAPAGPFPLAPLGLAAVAASVSASAAASSSSACSAASRCPWSSGWLENLAS